MKDNAILLGEERLLGNDIYFAESKIESHYPLHFHDFYELEICVEGTGYQYVNGNRYEFDKHSFFVYHPNDYHEIFAETPLSLLNVAFNSTLIDEEIISDFFDYESEIVIHLTDNKLAQVREIIDMIRNIFESHRTNKDLILSHLLNALLLIVIGSEQRHEAIGKASKKNDVLQCIHKNFARSPSLEEISAYSGYQKNYFCEIFKKKTGMTYIEYLTAYKLNYAKKLLKVTQKSIKEIAIESGFSSANNFIREFKRKNNMTPKQFRNQRRDHLSSR